MEKTARSIIDKGAIPGIWFRPLSTNKVENEQMRSPYQFDAKDGVIIDPSHPESLQLIYNDVRRIRSWGFELIKFDFSSFDIISRIGLKDGDPPFYDRTKTTCSIIKNFYKTISAASGGGEQLGCNTINHLAAGILSAQRTGHDTSGRVYEITRAAACAAMIRLPQNNTFFSADPDCAAFTARVPIEANLDFLELCALSSVTTLASVTPGIMKGDDLKTIRRIYEIASLGGKDARPTDWLGRNAACKYLCNDGQAFEIDWYKTYDGCRLNFEWMN
jgi:alpha-galactosidase